MADWGSVFPQVGSVADDDILLVQDVSNTTESPAGTTSGTTREGFLGSVLVDLTNPVQSTDVTSIVKLTQAAYDSLTPNAQTMYVIVG